MNFEYSLDSLLDVGTVEALYSCQFIHHITFPIVGGFMFGYVTGIVSGSVLLILTPLNSFLMTIAIICGAVLSSLFTGYLADRFGRKKTILLSCLFYIVGSLVSIKVGIEMVVGRFLVGIGLGISSTCCPLYIAEITPKFIRGRIITIYQISLTFGLFLASIVNATLNTPYLKFILSTPAIPALFQLIGMLTVSESYRWLLSKNKIDEAIQVVRKLKQIPEIHITKFVENILESNILIEEGVQEQRLRKKFILCRILSDKIARKSLVLGCSFQMLAQLVGINWIMYNAYTFIKFYGKFEHSTALWLTSVLTFFNFITSFVAYKLIDKIGRKNLAIISLFGIFFSLVFLAVSVQVIQVRRLNPYKNYNCSKYLNCPDCVAHGCKFCQIGGNSGYSCADFTRNCNETHSIYDADNPCETKISWVFLFGLICYVISFAVGMGPIPWVITSEIYPSWCRGFNMALSTAVNWTFNFTILAFANYSYYGFWVFSGFTICGISLILRKFPETNQKNIEEISRIL